MQHRVDYFLGAAGVAGVCAMMLFWVLYGRPPYSFFAVLRVSVFVGAVYVAYSLWLASRKAAPLALMLLVVGWIHFSSKMRRLQWVPYDQAAAALFVLSALILLFTV